MNRPYAPPDGFEPVDSEVDGVVLFAPREQVEALEERSRCPGCGATLAWNPGVQALHCSYCSTQVDAQSGHDTGPGEFTVEATTRGLQGWGTDRPELRCDGCGGALTVERTQLASTCPLCASNQVHLHDDVSGGLRPTHVLPFTVAREAAATAAKEWLGSGWLRPTGILDAVHIEAMRGIYAPCWVFRADLRATYEVQVGTERTRRVRRANGSTHRKTTVSWRWEKGELHLSQLETTVAATARIRGIEEAGPYPTDALVPYTPDVLVGFSAQGYDISLPDGWETGRTRLRNRMRSACCAQHRGDRYRSFSAEVDLDDESWRYALVPLWISAYRWDGRTWIVVVNGATGKVEGTRPVVWWRVWATITAMLAPGLFIGACMGLPGLAFAGVGLFFLIFAAILLTAGGIGSTMVYGYAAGQETL